MAALLKNIGRRVHQGAHPTPLSCGSPPPVLSRGFLRCPRSNLKCPVKISFTPSTTATARPKTVQCGPVVSTHRTRKECQIARAKTCSVGTLCYVGARLYAVRMVSRRVFTTHRGCYQIEHFCFIVSLPSVILIDFSFFFFVTRIIYNSDGDERAAPSPVKKG